MSEYSAALYSLFPVRNAACLISIFPSWLPSERRCLHGCCMKGADIDGALLRHCKYLELLLLHLFLADNNRLKGREEWVEIVRL